ncbi:hypothetical protein P4O66_017989 [Electrophorus voltai]|uniref:Autoimmune regulator n=1 Tax=Electrophorus voltai TaxID=2609070 RepID=A0AAD8YSB7_9TELE|nr:hypothetical protein P4O66_017989 [Electrophorus voltai]
MGQRATEKLPPIAQEQMEYTTAIKANKKECRRKIPGSMSQVEAFGESELRSQLKSSRTEIAMAIHDPFPLLYGLMDHDIISGQLLGETLERKKKDGIHKAMYSLLSWLLEQNGSVLHAFWANLTKDYNQESYPKLQSLFSSLPKGMRMETKASRIPKLELQNRALADRKKRLREKQLTHQPHHYTKRALQASSGVKETSMRKSDSASLSQVSVSNSVQSVSASVQRAVTLSAGELPAGCGTVEEILIQQVIESGGAKKCIKVGGEFYSSNMEETASGHMPQTVENHGHHQGEPNTSATDAPAQPPLLEGGSSSTVDFSFFSSASLSAVTGGKSAPPAAFQVVSDPEHCKHTQHNVEEERQRKSCGICHLAQGELRMCAQCLQSYHTHCNFPNGRSRCMTCSRSWVLTENDAPSRAVQCSGEQVSAHTEQQLLNKDEIDSFIGEEFKVASHEVTTCVALNACLRPPMQKVPIMVWTVLIISQTYVGPCTDALSSSHCDEMEC